MGQMYITAAYCKVRFTLMCARYRIVRSIEKGQQIIKNKGKTILFGLVCCQNRENPVFIFTYQSLIVKIPVQVEILQITIYINTKITFAVFYIHPHGIFFEFQRYIFADVR